MNFKIFLFLLFFTVCCLPGCTEDPTDVGRYLLPAGDTLRIESREFTSTSDTTFLVPIVSNSGRLMVGTHNNVEAVSLLEFAGIPKFTTTQSIDSAVIVFPFKYSFFDSAGLFGMSAHRMKRTWSASSFRWDSLSGSYSDTVAGQFAGQIMSSDTAIRLRLDTSLIRLWSLAGSGSLVLKTAENVIGMNLILGFTNFTGTSVVPKLTMTYHDTSDTTLNTTSNASRGISVMHNIVPLASGFISIQSGTTTRSIVRFDSLGSSISPKASITAAQLILTLDATSSLLNKFSRDSLIAYYLRASTFPYDTIALASICSPQINGAKKAYVADVKNIVQQWIAGRPNNGIILHSYGEFSSLDLFVLYNSQAIPDSLRPRLKISYTVFP